MTALGFDAFADQLIRVSVEKLFLRLRLSGFLGDLCSDLGRTRAWWQVVAAEVYLLALDRGLLSEERRDLRHLTAEDILTETWK